MHVRHVAMLAIVLASLLVTSAANAKQDTWPRLPGATLLVGYAQKILVLTTPTETYTLQDNRGDSRESMAVTPSMSRDGRIIASGRIRALFPRVVTIQTYSIETRQWTEYRDLSGGGAVVISPDGSRLAFTADDEVYGRPVRIHFVELATKIESVSPVIGKYARGTLSWSPDGRQIAYDVNDSPFFHRPEIFILEVESGKMTKVANGEAPAWSPSGEWIAYLDNSDGWKTKTKLHGNTLWTEHPTADQLVIIRPNGEGLKILLKKDELMFAIWAPDSKKILVNQLASYAKFTMNVHLVDLATGGSTRKFKDTPLVYAWAVHE